MNPLSPFEPDVGAPPIDDGLQLEIAFYNPEGHIKRGFHTNLIDISISTLLEMAEFLTVTPGNRIVVQSVKRTDPVPPRPYTGILR